MLEVLDELFPPHFKDRHSTLNGKQQRKIHELYVATVHRNKQYDLHKNTPESLINRQELLVETTIPACLIMKMNFQNPMTLEPITARQTH